MQKIHIEEHTDRIIRQGKASFVPMHYVYLCNGGQKTYLFRQRKYYGVAQYFHRDLPVNAIHSHKWGRDKMVDKLMTKLPAYLSDAQRYASDYAA